ncbi:hypothetical protein ABAC460_01880 [Asticcacaulis sp. AC460]|uniref:hypothetical protein n=1 Tax=Asticcacaulis sp. AC460 TaxID=1282360 RepID=UPI0003C3C84A|nr:hypothetical protein [Asticcacaulis sp. AC460]ESQ93027.1 hypothetical protein ABAC460_01880 [Asticcacaulis sp. AC460]
MKNAFGNNLSGRPNVYRAAAWVRVLAGITLIGSLVVLGLVWLSGDTTLLSFLAIVAVVVMCGAGAVLRRRLSVWPDRFEFQGLFRRFSGRRDELLGYRTTSSRYGSYLHFHLKDGRRFTLPDYRSQAGLSTWLADVTDLDARDKAEYEAGLIANDAFGSDPAQRKRAIALQRQLLTGINIAGCACGAWLAFYPHPLLYARLACAAVFVAVLVMAALSNGRWALMWDIKNPKLKLAPAFLVPALALGFSFFVNDDVLDKMAAATPGLAMAAVVMGLVILIDRKIAFPAVLWTAAIVGAGAWGGVLLYNEAQDTTPPTVYRTVVVDKRINEGRRSTSYYVDVAAWGPADMPASLKVDYAVYERATTGQALCLRLHKGALGYRWIDYDCAAGPAAG